MRSLGSAVGQPIVQDKVFPCVRLPSARRCALPRPSAFLTTHSRSSQCSQHAHGRRRRDVLKSRITPSTSHVSTFQGEGTTWPKLLAIRAEALNPGSAGGSAADLAALEESEPWLGAVVYRRSAARQEFVFVTTLERLALPHLSSPASRAQAAETLMAEMAEAESEGGSGEGEEAGTAVVVRMSSSKQGRDIRLDGTAETVFAMQCHRCLCAVTEPIYSEFNLLLSASALYEPTKRSLGVILDPSPGDFNSLPADHDYGDEGDMLDLDLDDKLFFPADQRSIDVSKYVRDTVHLEIPLKVRCSPRCQGMCLGCGANLNVKECACGEEEWGSGRGGSKGSVGGGQRLDGLGAGKGKGKGKGKGMGMGMGMGGKAGGKGSLKEQLEQLYRQGADDDDGDERQEGP
ncbi:hypothetical protein CLOM_g5067 [Closterium sp. NIES-68]|nr:hypothetical protein CLOM_g5067 [Closterium sp. NIES-68]GJP64521.1 hypothetical protein CLOP_g21497 [Closterium sp. NIES-67]